MLRRSIAVALWLLACHPGCFEDESRTADYRGERDTGGWAPRSEEAPDGSPIVFIIADSSGLMERIPGCECKTPQCTECLPDCVATQSRWLWQLAALTGTFNATRCTISERTVENGASFDVGYYMPYHRPQTERGQRNDGLIDVYGSRVRFGVGVFDGVMTYAGAPELIGLDAFDRARSQAVEGSWSIGTFVDGAQRARPDGSVVGRVGYPKVPNFYVIDTGLRGPSADNGPLVFPTKNERSNNARVQSVLIATRPFGGTPIAAALDDLDAYLRTPSDQRASGPVYVLLTTDGYPDDDYRYLGCDCATESVDGSPCRGFDHFDRALLSCPYPRASAAARALRCGQGPACDDGVIERLFVVQVGAGFGSGRLDAIAAEGGTERARVATDAAELRRVLFAVLDQILGR